MSLWLSLRAGRIAGKAAIIYKDVLGVAPNPTTARFFQEMALYGSDEYNLAFQALLEELKEEYVNEHGDIVTEYLSGNDPKTVRILQSLEWMAQVKGIESVSIKKMKDTVRKIKSGG